MKGAWHWLAVLALLVPGAAAQAAAVAFEYRCDAAAAATVPAALPEEGWRKASEEAIPLASHAPLCWLRVASTSLAGRALRIKPANTPMAVTVYSQTGQVLASVRPGGLREQAIVGSTGILFPTLRAEDGTIYLRVQPASDSLALAAVDLPAQMQDEHDRDFFRFARGIICAIAAVVAAVLGWRSRDRAQLTRNERPGVTTTPSNRINNHVARSSHSVHSQSGVPRVESPSKPLRGQRSPFPQPETHPDVFAPESARRTAGSGALRSSG